MSVNSEDIAYLVGFSSAVITDFVAGNTLGAAGSSTRAGGYFTSTTAFGTGVRARLNRCKDHVDEMAGRQIGYHKDS